MEQNCERCKGKKAKLFCENCENYLCPTCDSYLHALPSKKKHIRNKLALRKKFDLIESKIKKNYSKINMDKVSKLNFGKNNNETKNISDSIEIDNYRYYINNTSSENSQKLTNEQTSYIDNLRDICGIPRKSIQKKNQNIKSLSVERQRKDKVYNDQNNISEMPDFSNIDYLNKNIIEYNRLNRQFPLTNTLPPNFLNKTISSKAIKDKRFYTLDNFTNSNSKEKSSKFPNRSLNKSTKHLNNSQSLLSKTFNNYRTLPNQNQFKNSSSNKKSFLSQEKLIEKRMIRNCIEKQNSLELSLNNSLVNTNKKLSHLETIQNSNKKLLEKKIDYLTSELNHARMNLSAEINCLNKHLNKVDENQTIIRKSPCRYYCSCNKECEQRIKYLQKIIDDQNESLNKLKIRNNFLENEIEKYKEIKEKLCDEKFSLKNDQMNIESFYQKKIDEIRGLHEALKQKLISDHEKQMEKMSGSYDKSKEKYLEIIREREDQLQLLIKNTKEEREEFNSIIDKLKSENQNLNDENEKSKKFIEELEGNIAELNQHIDTVENELSQNVNENESLREKVMKITQENNMMRKEKDKLHNVLYGRLSIKSLKKK